MDIVVMGRGHLGSYLKKRFNLSDDRHYCGELADFKIGSGNFFFVNTAGKTSLEWCEANPLEAFRCNVIAPLQAFREFKERCNRYCLFIHISSGCVWDGPFPPMGLGFLPTEPVTPQCFYSWTKASCDGLLLQESKGFNLAILRPRQVYSPLASSRNTLTKLCTYQNLITTQNSMTSAETIARTIERLTKYPSHCEDGRIINVFDVGVTSPYEVGVLLAEAGLRDIPIKLEKRDLDKVLHPKRVDTVLSDGFFMDLVEPPEVTVELKRVIKEYKENVVTKFKDTVREARNAH